MLSFFFLRKKRVLLSFRSSCLDHYILDYKRGAYSRSGSEKVDEID